MSSSHDEQPLTRRQLREMERQKPRKEREADAKAAEEADAARRAEAERETAAAAAVGDAPVAADAAFSRRARRQQGPAAADVPVTTVAPAAAAPAAAADAAAPAAEAAPAEHAVDTDEQPSTETETETIVPEIVSDEPVDDSEPRGSAEPIIDVVPLTEAVVVTGRETDVASNDATSDDTAEHIEVVTVADDAAGSSTEPEVVEQMVIDEPADEGDDSADDERGDAASPLASRFQSPADRAPQVAGENLPSSFDDLLSLRNTAAMNSISTTSALVLPTVPGSNDVGTALDETGEVIITGSIDLPPSFGSLGAPATGLESGDLDAILERSETDATASDVAPVSAARAISTNTSSTSLIAPPKRARANAPVVLAITAGVLAVGVVSLLLAVFVFRVF